MAKDDLKSCSICVHFGDKTSCPLLKNVPEGQEPRDFSGICHDFERYYAPVFDMRLTLKELNNLYIFICPTDTEKLLFYKNGIYEPAKPLIHSFLENKYKEGIKAYQVEEVIKHLKRASYIDRENINRYTNKIPIENGLLNLLTREKEAFDPEQVYTFKLNVEYNPEAKCPKWLEFVKQVVSEDDIPLLQEIMGYCLLPSVPYHKMFWLYGTGRNGKGVVVRTLENILGKESCGNLNLSEFRESRRFSLAQLYGKLLNVSSEPQLSKYGLPTAILKMITGQDTISAELKGRNERLIFKNFAKVLVLGNHFPKVDDHSFGWWARVIVLNFPNSFEGEQCIPNIEKRWLPEETSGILNWMLEGLYRLHENNGFSSSKTAEETKTEFMRVSDPFNAWLNDCVDFVPEAYLTRQEAYDSYRDYSATELEAEPDSTTTFYKKMRQTPKIKSAHKRINGKMARIFQGISLKPLSEAGEANEADSTLRQNFKENKKHEDISPASSASCASNSVNLVNLDASSIQLQCFGCRRILTEDTSFTYYEGKPICFPCFNKIEALKKKKDSKIRLNPW